MPQLAFVRQRPLQRRRHLHRPELLDGEAEVGDAIEELDFAVAGFREVKVAP